MDGEEILRAAARAEAEDLLNGPDAHPTPDELLAYQSRELAAAEVERVRDHLAVCGECARVIVDLESFSAPEPDGEEAGLSELERAVEWRRLGRRLSTPAEEARVPAAARPAFTSPVFAYAVAASLLVAVVGLAGWVSELRGRIAAPRVNVLISDLIPRDAARERTEETADRIRVPAGTEHVLLLLNLVEPRTFASYRVTITDPGGREVLSSRELRRSAEGNFTLEVSRRLLAAGKYRIALYGRTGEDEELLAGYALAIDYE